jgi:hypothetical protein
MHRQANKYAFENGLVGGDIFGDEFNTPVPFFLYSSSIAGAFVR